MSFGIWLHESSISLKIVKVILHNTICPGTRRAGGPADFVENRGKDLNTPCRPIITKTIRTAGTQWQLLFPLAGLFRIAATHRIIKDEGFITMPMIRRLYGSVTRSWPLSWEFLQRPGCADHWCA